MRIAVVGMKHCGSTMLLNIIWTGLRLNNNCINQDSFEKDADIYVTKTHAYTDEYKEYTLISPMRDLRDSSLFLVSKDLL